MHEGKEDKGRRNLETNESAQRKERATLPTERYYMECVKTEKRKSLSNARVDVPVKSYSDEDVFWKGFDFPTPSTCTYRTKVEAPSHENHDTTRAVEEKVEQKNKARFRPYAATVSMHVSYALAW